ncbi:DUF502 domain-containing protein [Candidatus Desulforudis audaxviator]|uniref:DUF502 domain-containing protein n=1 Tax=Desulforudis audaxviator (strain MP104C) TaxID=477974 RepID=B1I430_DESAP|nr:DUF502 domain-containing protein [Candidatus Desulforudis audaxviator]ACA59663.1 protein of unknown function DUF502 [Candidatus Desulforudis audaxviator MP104C]AZK59655.1 Transporter [Candidatus Desulforudis audaxviator]
MLKNIRRYLLTGIMVLLPLAATLYLLWSIFIFIDRIVGSVILFVIGRHLPGAGFLITLVVVFLAGLLATNLVGRKLIEFWEAILLRIPLANWIYKVVRQIVNSVSRQDQRVFREVVLVEFPRRESWVVGFVVGEADPHIFGKVGEDPVKLFMPTVPNPTSGYLLVVPRKDTVPLPISVEDGFKMVLSAGIVVPNHNSNNNNHKPVQGRNG